jgi:hypothetical protein
MSPVTVHVPVDAGLSRLLRTSAADQPHYGATKIVGDMANACFPGNWQRNRNGDGGTWTGGGNGNVQIEKSMKPVIADHLAALLAKARADGDPVADVLAGVLSREFGRNEATA